MTNLAPPQSVNPDFAVRPRMENHENFKVTPTTTCLKFSLAFILNDRTTIVSPVNHSVPPLPIQSHSPICKVKSRCRCPRRALTANEKRAARTCCIEDCKNYTINRGLCFRHGGGKACSRPGCTTSAKHRGLCWKHGGSTLCTVENCTRGAKSRGLCWSHGGGTKCSMVNCQKFKVSKGLCYAHGGGKRDRCKRPFS